MKISDIKINMNTRKLSKVLDIISDHLKQVSEEFKHMDLYGCPDCGSENYRIEHQIDGGKFLGYEAVKCTFCGCEYVRTDKNEVDLLYRK